MWTLFPDGDCLLLAAECLLLNVADAATRRLNARQEWAGVVVPPFQLPPPVLRLSAAFLCPWTVSCDAAVYETAAGTVLVWDSRDGWFRSFVGSRCERLLTAYHLQVIDGLCRGRWWLLRRLLLHVGADRAAAGGHWSSPSQRDAYDVIESDLAARGNFNPSVRAAVRADGTLAVRAAAGNELVALLEAAAARLPANAE